MYTVYNFNDNSLMKDDFKRYLKQNPSSYLLAICLID